MSRVNEITSFNPRGLRRDGSRHRGIRPKAQQRTGLVSGCRCHPASRAAPRALRSGRALPAHDSFRASWLAVKQLKRQDCSQCKSSPVRRAQRFLVPELPNRQRMRALNQIPPSATLLGQENLKSLLPKSLLFKQNLGSDRQIPSQVRRESFFIMVATVPRIAGVSDGQHFTTQTLRPCPRTPHVPCGRGHKWRLLACPGRASAEEPAQPFQRLEKGTSGIPIHFFLNEGRDSPPSPVSWQFQTDCVHHQRKSRRQLPLSSESVSRLHLGHQTRQDYYTHRRTF